MAQSEDNRSLCNYCVSEQEHDDREVKFIYSNKRQKVNMAKSFVLRCFLKFVFLGKKVTAVLIGCH